MKKIYFCALALIIAISLFSDQVTLNYAQTVAQNWHSLIYDTEYTAIADYSIETSQGIQTAFIFNFRDGGFVITSASNDAEPILAYNEIGSINSDYSPSFDWLINCYVEQVYEIIDENLYCQTLRNKWSELYTNSYNVNRTEVSLPMDPSWSQGTPYNDFVPMIDTHRCVAGCGPIAMAQVLNYYKYMNDYSYANGFACPNYAYETEYPEDTNIEIKIDEDSDEYDFKTFEELDDYLLNVRQCFSAGNSVTDDADMAAIAYACGIACRADFGVSATGSGEYVGSYAEHFGAKVELYHRQSYQGDWELLLRNEIDQERIIQYSGKDDSVGGPAHAFILHGYFNDLASDFYWYKVNWGWSGSSDGWYLLDNLSPELNPDLNFIISQKAIVNFEPAVFTIVGKLSAYFPECDLVNVNSPLSVNVVAHYAVGTPPLQEIVNVDGVYRNSRLYGNYYIQLEEQLPIGTEFWVTFESDLYENVTVYDEITSDSDVHYMEPFELFWVVKPLFNGWNWESFPILDRVGNGTADAITVLEEIPGFPEEITFIDVLNTGPIGYEDPYDELYYANFEWNPLENYNFQSTRCFKIQISPNLGVDYEYRILDVPGTLLDETTSIDLLAGQDNWVGYWIQETQDINDAFDDDWENIESIKAEDWEWKDMSNNRGLEPAYYPIRPLNYGKGYVVKVKEDILEFQWHVSGELGTQYTRQSPQDFIYEEKPDYESVIIDTIEGGNNIVEIGVFDNEVCVGAAVVDEFPLQILAYTDAVNRGGELTFHFSYGGGRGYQSAEGYSVLNTDTGEFESRTIRLGDLKHNILRLYADDEQEIVPEIERTVLHSNYPNPFNPTTQISYSTHQEGKVNLSVYNIKGQLVKTLINRRVVSDSHIVNWNGQDNAGKRVSSGVYFYKLKTHDMKISKKMLLLK